MVPKVPPNKGKTREEAMAAGEQPLKKNKSEEKPEKE